VPKLKDVKIGTQLRDTPTKVLTIDATTADLARKVAHADGLRMSDFIDRAIKAYVTLNHPDWELVEEGQEAMQTVRDFEAAAGPAKRGRGRRSNDD
jgi:hypothetical protein